MDQFKDVVKSRSGCIKAVSTQSCIYLNCATAAALHQIADVSRLNACSNERLYIVMIQFFQLQI